MTYVKLKQTFAVDGNLKRFKIGWLSGLGVKVPTMNHNIFISCHLSTPNKANKANK